MANGDGFMVQQPCAVSHQPLAMTCFRLTVAILFSQLTIESSFAMSCGPSGPPCEQAWRPARRL